MGEPKYFRSASESTTLCPIETTDQSKEAPWLQVPFNAPNYNPLTEWGDHYEKIYLKDLWSQTSSFDVQELHGSVVSMISNATSTSRDFADHIPGERRITGARQVESLLEVSLSLTKMFANPRY